MKDIFSIDFRDAIRKVVRRELKEKFTIKAPKDRERQHKYSESENPFQVFGVRLDKVPSKSVNGDDYFSVPVFLVDAFNYLNNHLKVEGLFRKSGSIGRQKMLREIVEREGTCCSCDFVQPHDVASIVKQFFRELPDPLLTNRLSSLFLKCLAITSSSDSISALVLCCILLPDEHLRVLRYFSKFVAEVAAHSIESKMTLTNLSIIFAPNLMSTQGKDKNSEKSMKDVTQILEMLFKNSHLIGMVPDMLFDKAKQVNLEGGFYSSSGDELENDEPVRRGRTMARSEKKRDRSKSITGFLKKNFKPGERNLSRHARSKSEKASPVGKSNRCLKVQISNESLTNANGTQRKHKRSASTKRELSPIRKSPRLHARKELSNLKISAPVIKTMSNQVVVTPRRYLQPIKPLDQQQANNAEKSKEKKVNVVLPSRFEFTKSSSSDSQNQPAADPQVKALQNKLYRSHSTYAYTSSTQRNDCDDKTDNTTDNSNAKVSRISRTTQKPHVRKTRRSSSLNRRRERYTSGRGRRQLPKTPPQELLDYSVISPSELPEISMGNILSDEDSPLKETCSLQDLYGKNDHQTRRSASRQPLTEKNHTPPFTPSNKSNKKTSAVKKPLTPYSVTPQVGVKRYHKADHV